MDDRGSVVEGHSSSWDDLILQAHDCEGQSTGRERNKGPLFCTGRFSAAAI